MVAVEGTFTPLQTDFWSWHVNINHFPLTENANLEWSSSVDVIPTKLSTTSDRNNHDSQLDLKLARGYLWSYQEQTEIDLIIIIINITVN